MDCDQFKDMDATEELGERFRILVDQTLKLFILNGDVDDFIFPEALSSTQRKYIHEKAQKLGLRSKSYGKDPNRRLKISKRHNEYQMNFHLEFDESSTAAHNEVLERYYSKAKTGKTIKRDGALKSHQVKTYGTFFHGRPVHVQPPRSSDLLSFRKKLPTWEIRDKFLDILSKNQIVIISSETGSGKSTQIPQFIMDECCEQHRRCRIVCTQPRRLATVSVAQRVAEERGETLGGSVGYEIRLDTHIGNQSALIYCTNGIMIKSLMDNEKCLENFTHVIVDEIHERDKYTDFLLIYLKKNLQLFPNLRLILMSATMDIESFKAYFQDVSLSVMYIPGKLYPVQEYFLDDILPKINYKLPDIDVQEDAWRIGSFDPNEPVQDEVLEDAQMDVVVMDCVNFGTESSFSQLMQMILCEAAPVNHQTQVKRYTPLMAAAMHGNVEVVEQLLHLGEFFCNKNKTYGKKIFVSLTCDKLFSIKVAKSVFGYLFIF